MRRARGRRCSSTPRGMLHLMETLSIPIPAPHGKRNLPTTEVHQPISDVSGQASDSAAETNEATIPNVNSNKRLRILDPKDVTSKLLLATASFYESATSVSGSSSETAKIAHPINDSDVDNTKKHVKIAASSETSQLDNPAELLTSSEQVGSLKELLEPLMKLGEIARLTIDMTLKSGERVVVTGVV